jgi:penicillin-binding protein 2
MTEDRSQLLYGRLEESLINGFYPYGSSKATDVEGRIDYITQYEAKLMLDEELDYALSGDLEEIVYSALNDFESGMGIETNQKIKQIVDLILNDTSERALKTKAKEYIYNMLFNMYSEDTITLMETALKEVDEEILDIAYHTVYSNAYNRYKNKGENPEVLEELQRRITSIEETEFDGRAQLLEKVKERIIDTLVDYLFETVDMEWSTAITIRTAIGQGYNAYAPVQMARYTAGLANGKEVYNLTIIDGIFANKGSGTYEANEAKLYNELNISQTTLDAIYEGMYQVVKGTEGTARSQFTTFPLDLAAKTGTAQEGADEHSWFVGFAPLQNPEIAIVTSMYAADGLGSYNYKAARQILESYFGFDKEINPMTLENTLTD